MYASRQSQKVAQEDKDYSHLKNFMEVLGMLMLKFTIEVEGLEIFDEQDDLPMGTAGGNNEANQMVPEGQKKNLSSLEFLKIKLRQLMQKTSAAIRQVKPLQLLQFFSYNSSQDAELNSMIYELR